MMQQTHNCKNAIWHCRLAKNQAGINSNNAGFIGFHIDALASFFLVTTLSSIFLTFASINYFNDKEISQSKTPQAELANASFGELNAQLGTFENLTVSNNTNLNGDIFIKGEKLDIAQILSESSSTSKGVTSLQDETGDIQLIPGNGITIDGLTITNNAPNAIQNTFEKIKVSNNEIDTLFGASNGDDTLTFVAGGNINIASDTTNKKLTISSTSPSEATGWQLSGSTVSLINNSYNVGIGTTTPLFALHVVSSVTPAIFEKSSTSTSTIAGSTWLQINNPDTTNNNNAGITFNGYRSSDAATTVSYAGIYGVFADHTAVDGDLAFVTRDDDVLAERLRIESDGTTTIGDTSTSRALGSASFSVNLDTVDIGQNTESIPAVNLRANRTAADATLGFLYGLWNDTPVARITFASGTDNVQKDDGWIKFEVSNGGILEAGRFTQVGQLQLPVTGSSGGLLIGGDTQLYRSAADTLAVASGDSLSFIAGQLLFPGNGGALASGAIGIRSDATNLWVQAIGSQIYTVDSDNSSTDNFQWYTDAAGVGGTNLMTLSSAGQLQLPVTGSSAGILIGSDFQIYRLGADFGYTPDTFQVGGAFQADTTAYLPSTNGAGSGLVIGSDTNLYRGAANRLDLASGDSLNIVSGDLSVNTDDLFVQQSTGNVGIGTASPSSFKLQVAGNIGVDVAPNPARTITRVDEISTDYASIYCISATDCKIAYMNTAGPGLKMADCDDATCSTKTLTAVDATANVGYFASIFCLATDDCKIAYHDEANQNLMMADCDNATCSSKTLTTVDAVSSANTGALSSIYCLATDDCKIVYHDEGTGHLMIADCDDATCSTKTLTAATDAANAGVEKPSIFCLATDDCKISLEANNTDLVMIDCDNTTCSSRTLTVVDSVTSAATGGPTSIYCISSTDCKISYIDRANTNLMVADCDTATCSTKTLTVVDSDITFTTGYSSNSIFCIATDDCKIAYQDSGAQPIMMADCDDATCSTKTLTTVDSDSSIYVASIYCLSSTDCKIAYSDGTVAGHLTLVDCNSSACATSTTGGYNLGNDSLYFNSVYADTYYGKNTTVSSFDLAEEYYSTDALTPGEIVSVYTGETVRDNQVARTTQEYEQATIGIVSTEPGITLANWQQKDRTGMYPIALAGRVPVKVSTENGPIQAGDAITSSSIPGVGMKATKAGRIVGTALQSYNGEGIGSVIVFVNPSYFLGTALAQTVSDDPLFSLLDSIGIINTQYQGQILSSNQVQKLINEQSAVLGISTEQTSSVSAQLTALSGRLDEFEQGLNSQSERISSISATLANLPIINLAQLATGSAVLGITIVEEDFAVSGNTTLSNLSTIGNITVANNLALGATSINTIGEPLQIQPLKQGNVSFMNGLVTIDTTGNVVVSGKITAPTIETGKLIITTDATSQTIGSATLPAGQTEIVIETSAVTPESKILLSPTTQLNGKSLYVSNKTTDTGFTVTLDGEAIQSNITLDWFILEAKSN